jgi:hypothetical protein
MTNNEPPTMLGEAIQPGIKEGATPDKATTATASGASPFVFFELVRTKVP